MSKRKARPTTKRRRNSGEREHEILARRALERSVRYQRKIVQLCRQLRTLIVKADDALRMVGRIAIERDMPTSSLRGDPSDDQEHAAAVAGVDPRD